MADEEDKESVPGQKKPSPRKPHRVSKEGWKQMLTSVKKSISDDHLSIIAAGVAFYVLLGLIPGIAAGISIYGLVADPADVKQHFVQVEGVMPEQAAQLLEEQMDRIASQQGAAGVGAIVGILLGLWAGSRATKATMEALNITYGEKEGRGFLKLSAIGLALTLALVLFGLLAIALIAVLPPLLNALSLPGVLEKIIAIGMWPLLLLIGIMAITMVYRYGPSRRQPHWKWLTWGSGTAAILWLIVSVLFSFYIANFRNYNETYGSLGAIVILLMWFYISAFVVLLGAEIDAAIENKTEEEVLPE